MISVGIDISKEKSMVCIMRPYGEVIASPYEIQHTSSGLDSLCEHILSFNDEVRVVMEATEGKPKKVAKIAAQNQGF